MKIALCFSGQARSYEKGYEYYKRNLLDHYDVDVYIHTWKFPEENKLKELYKPVMMKTEVPPTTDADQRFTNTPNIEKHPPRFTYRMLYSMHKVKETVRWEFTKFQYDWIIKTRTDYALNVRIPFEELDNTQLYIPNCRMVPERDFGNDQFAFGSEETMFKYMSTFPNIQKYYDSGYQFIGEEMMKANLHEHNLRVTYVDMNNPFPPGNYNGTWHSLIRDDIEEWRKS